MSLAGVPSNVKLHFFSPFYHLNYHPNDHLIAAPPSYPTVVGPIGCLLHFFSASLGIETTSLLLSPASSYMLISPTLHLLLDGYLKITCNFGPSHVVYPPIEVTWTGKKFNRIQQNILLNFFLFMNILGGRQHGYLKSLTISAQVMLSTVAVHRG